MEVNQNDQACRPFSFSNIASGEWITVYQNPPCVSRLKKKDASSENSRIYIEIIIDKGDAAIVVPCSKFLSLGFKKQQLTSNVKSRENALQECFLSLLLPVSARFLSLLLPVSARFLSLLLPVSARFLSQLLPIGCIHSLDSTTGLEYWTRLLLNHKGRFSSVN